MKADPMHTISIHRAQPIQGVDRPQPVTIIIDAVFPSGSGNGEAIHTRDATTLTDALASSLPGGTWDRLVACMLERHASLLRVNRQDLRREASDDQPRT